MKKIGIIGFGNMGSVIGEQLKADYKLVVFDKDSAKLGNISDMGIASSISALVDETDTIILAVKPQDFDTVLNEARNCKHLTDKLFISIAAGITTLYIEKILGVVRVIRAMPNLPARIGKGMICLARGKFASDQDLEFSDDLFEYLGEVMEIKESMMNAATAISGSSPGWYFERVNLNYQRWENEHEAFLKEFIIDLKEAAEKIGFNPYQAEFISSTTGTASDLMLMKLKKPAAELRDQVTSKGGTTEAGLEVLRAGGSLTEAAKAAVKRAAELSKE